MKSQHRSNAGYLGFFGLGVLVIMTAAMAGCTDQVLGPMGEAPSAAPQATPVPEYSSSDVEAQAAPAAPGNFNVEVVSYGKGKDKGATVRFTWTNSASGVDAFWIVGSKSDRTTVFWAPGSATSAEYTFTAGVWDFYIRATNASELSSAWVGPVTVNLCGAKGPCK